MGRLFWQVDTPGRVGVDTQLALLGIADQGHLPYTTDLVNFDLIENFLASQRILKGIGQGAQRRAGLRVVI